MYNDILHLLENGYFVPMFKSDDDCVQPTIGKPFSPKSSTIIPPLQVIIIIYFKKITVKTITFYFIIFI